MGFQSLIFKAVPSASSSINVLEFAKSLVNLLPKSVYDYGLHNVTSRRKIGLAISGGVDSMALALLCSQIKDIQASHFKEDEDLRILQTLQQSVFCAFVVNHDARKGSLEEAQSVVDILKKRDISAEVLNINWGVKDGSHPVKQPNFESLARRYRFQTLGKACYRHGINALMLAHHQDDQAETLLMRLANGHGIMGLTGIRSDANIPECHGIYGVHKSGERQLISDYSSIGIDSAHHQTQLAIANGGVKVYRPLLNFSKDRLRATCVEAKMEWFEDHTNQDPTLTMRNAVRKFNSGHKIPLALSKSSLLALSKRASDRVNAQQDIVHSLLAKCFIERFETRSGILQIRFPDIRQLTRNIGESHNTKMIAAMLLRRIITLITPNEHVELATLHTILPAIFPELLTMKNPTTKPNKQTIAGVQFDPLPTPTDSSQGKPEWLLSRQILPRSKLDHVFLTIPPSSKFSSWSLIDNRYWLRIKHNYKHVTIQPLTPSLLTRFKNDLCESERKRLRGDLKILAPGGIRWTLLAIVVDGRVACLPTLGYFAESKSEIGGERLEVEVLYKKVDLKGLVIEGKAS